MRLNIQLAAALSTFIVLGFACQTRTKDHRKNRYLPPRPQAAAVEALKTETGDAKTFEDLAGQIQSNAQDYLDAGGTNTAATEAAKGIVNTPTDSLVEIIKDKDKVDAITIGAIDAQNSASNTSTSTSTSTASRSSDSQRSDAMQYLSLTGGVVIVLFGMTSIASLGTWRAISRKNDRIADRIADLIQAHRNIIAERTPPDSWFEKYNTATAEDFYHLQSAKSEMLKDAFKNKNIRKISNYFDSSKKTSIMQKLELELDIFRNQHKLTVGKSIGIGDRELFIDPELLKPSSSTDLLSKPVVFESKKTKQAKNASFISAIGIMAGVALLGASSALASTNLADGTGELTPEALWMKKNAQLEVNLERLHANIQP